MPAVSTRRSGAAADIGRQKASTRTPTGSARALKASGRRLYRSGRDRARRPLDAPGRSPGGRRAADSDTIAAPWHFGRFRRCCSKIGNAKRYRDQHRRDVSIRGSGGISQTNVRSASSLQRAWLRRPVSAREARPTRPISGGDCSYCAETIHAASFLKASLKSVPRL